MTVTIRHGDCREVLKTLPDQSVHCCVTSPPYFGLRDYGHAGQIGLEATPDAFVAEMVAVFAEVRRVLRDDGTLWLNLGSSYISDYIESHEYVIRPDITPQERDKALRAIAAAITTALPEVRESDASAKSEMPGMLSIREIATAELRQTTLPEVQQTIHRPQSSCGEGAWEVLQPLLREVGKSNAQESNTNCRVPNVRAEIRQIQSGDEKDQRNEALLLADMLVQPQCEGQSLSLDGRPRWTDESGRHEMAQVRTDAGQMALSNMPCDEEIGGPPYSPVRDSQRTPLGSEQRFDAVPQVSRRIPSSRTRARRNPFFHSIGASDGLEKISIPKTAIPADVLHLFQPRHILKPKDDAMIPEKVALALRDDGWICRQTIIWSKPNPMPESVTDRCTKAHEYIFLLSKSARYFYDADAIKEAVAESSVARVAQNDGNPIWNGDRARGSTQNPQTIDITKMVPADGMRNKRSVWDVATHPFSEAHFATFPPDLIEPCIKAGCPEKCCTKCGSPWERQIERGESSWAARKAAGHPTSGYHADDGAIACRDNPAPRTGMKNEGGLGWVAPKKTIGWSPSCSCDAGTVSGTVLDPFGGAGTTGLVADRLGRDAILIELNPDYAAMAQRRIEGDGGMFASVAAL